MASETYNDSTEAASRLGEMSLEASSGSVRLQEQEQPATSSYLTPLQHSLVYELTTRRTQIAEAQRRIDFWHRHEQDHGGEGDAAAGPSSRRARDQFGRDVVDEPFLDDLIRQRRERLAELQQARCLREAIVESADAAHSINASMAAAPPAPFSATSDTHLSLHDGPPEQLPLRSLAARRDDLALQFLRLDDQIKEVRTKRRQVAKEINAVRESTASLAAQVQEAKASLQAQREADLSVSLAEEGGSEHRRIEELQEAVDTARGKREMVKGVLRGLILESGLDWYGHRDLRTLVLSLGDDEVNSSDEEIHLFSDEEDDDDEDESSYNEDEDESGGPRTR